MIEIKGKKCTYIVYKEDIVQIEHYNDYESYVHMKGRNFDIIIGENEYQRLKKLLCEDNDYEKDK